MKERHIEPEIGIAISVYDKFEDLAILHDILRENFEQSYQISVCSANPDLNQEIEQKNLDVDVISEPPKTDYSPEMNGEKAQIRLHSRILESIQNSVEPLLEETDYVIHLHADAWPLSEKKINEIIERLEVEEKKVAARGLGPGCRNPSYWNGHVMDQFLFMDSSYFAENNVLKFNPLDLLPHAGIHTSLMILLMGKIGLSKIWFYSDMTEDLWWDGAEKDRFARPLPFTFSPEWNFLHLPEEEFPNKYGVELKAKYLRQFDIINGRHVENLHENTVKSDKEILKELEKIEKSQDSLLKIFGFNDENLARRFKKKDEIISKLSNRKYALNRAFKNYLRRVYFGLHNLLYNFHSIDGKRLKGRNRMECNLYRDSTWPNKHLSEHYISNARMLAENEWPENWSEHHK